MSGIASLPMSRLPMSRLTVHQMLAPDSLQRVHQLIERVHAKQGFRPLSDQAWIALRSDQPLISVLLNGDDIETAPLLGYAQVSLVHDVHYCEMVLAEDVSWEQAGAMLGEAVGASNGGEFRWWAFNATDEHTAIAQAAGLRESRRLVQLRCPLPTALAPNIHTRAFELGRDEQAFLTVNNRAFASHGEQGSWTQQTLAERFNEPWFDRAGFLLHETDGRLSGFCWTKIHPSGDDPVGEIYVIATDPDFSGRGLGTQLTLAGLQWLSNAGLKTGMLFVDADNHNAVRMYERIGFSTYRTDVMFARGDTE
jgi:mycothiol synthase